MLPGLIVDRRAAAAVLVAAVVHRRIGTAVTPRRARENAGGVGRGQELEQRRRERAGVEGGGSLRLFSDLFSGQASHLTCGSLSRPLHYRSTASRWLCSELSSKYASLKEGVVRPLAERWCAVEQLAG